MQLSQILIEKNCVHNLKITERDLRGKASFLFRTRQVFLAKFEHTLLQCETRTAAFLHLKMKC